LLSGCSPEASSGAPKAARGILDLTGWDFGRQGPIKLDGQWEFYESRFVNDQELPSETPDMYINVPGTWNGYSKAGKILLGQGYGTYRLHVKTRLPADSMLGLRIYPLSSAYRFYIDDKLVANNGNPAASAAEEVGQYQPRTVFFYPPSEEFDIIVHLSNFQYARGGFWYSAFMGGSEEILNLHDAVMGKETFLIGALLMLALFYLAIFILRREFKYALYFSCLCLAMALALDMVGQFILLRFISGLSLQAVIFLWYSSIDWTLFFLVLYVHELFKSRFSGLVMKVYLGVTSLSQLLYIFTPSPFYTRFAFVSDFIGVVGVLGTIVMVAIGIKRGQRDGWLHIFSIVIVLVAYVHDMLFWTNQIDGSFGEIIYIGLFLFIFLQMVIQAQRIRIFHDHKTAAEFSFLQAQIKPHFLYNALNTVVFVSRYDANKARELLINFSNYLRGSFDFKNLQQAVPLKNEIELAKAYVEIEKARFEEKVEVKFDIGEDLEVKVPTLMLQPVIENAINHGVLPKPEGGHIEVSVKKEGRRLVFRVKDDGVGMAFEKKGGILQLKFGSGVGLFNIDSRLKRLYGKGLQINSSPGLGTEVTWSIPIKREGE
jgi:two-component system LytT family sensor kinase